MSVGIPRHARVGCRATRIHRIARAREFHDVDARDRAITIARARAGRASHAASFVASSARARARVVTVASDDWARGERVRDARDDARADSSERANDDGDDVITIALAAERARVDGVRGARLVGDAAGAARRPRSSCRTTPGRRACARCGARCGCCGRRTRAIGEGN